MVGIKLTSDYGEKRPNHIRIQGGYLQSGNFDCLYIYVFFDLWDFSITKFTALVSMHDILANYVHGVCKAMVVYFFKFFLDGTIVYSDITDTYFPVIGQSCGPFGTDQCTNTSSNIGSNCLLNLESDNLLFYGLRFIILSKQSTLSNEIHFFGEVITCRMSFCFFLWLLF